MEYTLPGGKVVQQRADAPRASCTRVSSLVELHWILLFSVGIGLGRKAAVGAGRGASPLLYTVYMHTLGTSVLLVPVVL